jgi:hypothetical protein
MKYENYATVKETVEAMEKNDEKLKDLEGSIEIHVCNQNGGRIYNISIQHNSEHQFKHFAMKLVADIRKDLGDRNQKLLDKLEKL